MRQELKGNSELAMLADGLPVRARVCLTLLAADIALRHLQGSPDLHLALDTLAFALNWQKRARVDIDKWENMLDNEETGLAWAEVRAQERSKEESLAWCVLTTPIYYAAYHAILAANRPLSGSFCNTDEIALDDLEEDLRKLEPSSMALMHQAAAYLRQHPDALFAQLKAHLSKLSGA